MRASRRVTRGGLLLVAAVAACGGASAPPPSKPSEHAPRPTREQCVRVVEHLGNVLPDLFHAPARDVEDCLALPVPLVECFALVTDEDSLDRCVREWCQGHRDACPRASVFAPRPLASECERLLDHLLALRGASAVPTERDRATFVADCRAHVPIAVVTCALGARELNRLEACANDEPRAPR